MNGQQPNECGSGSGNESTTEKKPVQQGKPKQETSGRITFKIDNFSVFAQQNFASKQSDPVNIHGVQWRIKAYLTKNEKGAKYLDFYVWKDEKAPDCRALVKHWLISVKDGIKSYVYVGQTRVFSTKVWGVSDFKSIQELLDPANGWLENDTVTLEAEVFADRPFAKAPRPDILIVNDHQINIDKYYLAVHSSYFKKRFFEDYGAWTDNNANGGPLKVEIDEAVSSVEDFEMMIDCTYPEHPPLDDDCIEGVLNLADQFSVDRVEDICVQFLMEKSDKCAMFKYRMGEKYGFGALKEVALMELTTEFPKSGKEFAEHNMELCKMEVPAQREFAVLLDERVHAVAAKRA